MKLIIVEIVKFRLGRNKGGEREREREREREIIKIQNNPLLN